MSTDKKLIILGVVAAVIVVVAFGLVFGLLPSRNLQTPGQTQSGTSTLPTTSTQLSGGAAPMPIATSSPSASPVSTSTTLVILSINPSTISAGSIQNITLSGTGFSAVTGMYIDNTPVDFALENNGAINFVLPATLAPGAYHVVVTTDDENGTTSPTTLTVTASHTATGAYQDNTRGQ